MLIILLYADEANVYLIWMHVMKKKKTKKHKTNNTNKLFPADTWELNIYNEKATQHITHSTHPNPGISGCNRLEFTIINRAQKTNICCKISISDDTNPHRKKITFISKFISNISKITKIRKLYMLKNSIVPQMLVSNYELLKINAIYMALFI